MPLVLLVACPKALLVVIVLYIATYSLETRVALVCTALSLLPCRHDLKSVVLPLFFIVTYANLLAKDGRILAGREVAGAGRRDGEEGTKAAGA